MLTNRKREFIKYYLSETSEDDRGFRTYLNATASARKAGYSLKTAGSKGQQLLKDIDIAKLIEEYMTQYNYDDERIRREIGKVASDDVKPADKLRALELLGKISGMLRDNNVNVNVQQVVTERAAQEADSVIDRVRSGAIAPDTTTCSSIPTGISGCTPSTDSDIR